MKFVKTLLILSVFLVSCSVQKRHYMKGLYFERMASKKQASGEGNTIKSFYKTNPAPQKDTKFNAVASVGPAESIQKTEIQEPQAAKPVIVFENCDTLFFRDGTVIAAKIIELKANEIRYRYCTGGETEVIRVVLKSEVEHLEYSTGLKEFFEPPKQTAPVVSNNKQPRKTSTPAIVGFIFSLLAYPAAIAGVLYLYAGLFTSGALVSSGILLIVIGILLAIAGLILDIVGLAQTTGNKTKYKGLGLAIAGLIIILLPVLLLIFSTLSI